ncbi:MAG: type II secretion system protein E [Desulfuromonadaceae bacterium GWC2_58_13]|nr:MAG: type II secretion system protein E [Desulfuromonadaceae bacterium GWC2_58_13]
MPQKQSLTLSSVGRVLLQKGYVSQEQFELIQLKGEAQAARLQKQLQAGASRRFLGADLVSPAEVICSFNLESPADGRLLTEDAVTEAIAQAAGLDYQKIDLLKLDLAVVTEHIPRAFAQKNLMVPVAESEGIVTVAVADPFNTEPIEDIKRARNIQIKRVLASRSDILKVLGEFFGFRASVIAAENEMGRGTELSNLEQYFQMRGQAEIEGSDKHIISAVESLLRYAFDQRASDIHIEPKREKSLVRLRVDGVLHNIHTVPSRLHPPIVSRIKLLSRLDLAEKRRPQDGRIKTRHKDKEIELRVSTLPVAFGEKVVIRIFDPEVLMQDLERIGFYPREYQLYSSFIRKPNGIILVTGPTGSGKTTTLYSSLRALASPEVNIVTVEDPIEMVMEEFNQVGVQAAIDVTFATVLRNILRQDPDIIMIGEIRDKETADNAVQAALTGHLVLSTLHTNDAPASVIRLLDLGVPSFLIASTVIGINAQRLVRTICTHCKRQRLLTAEEIAYLHLDGAEIPVWEGTGCNECRGTGYKGRTGIFEIMDFTPRVREVLSDRIDLPALYEAVRADGMVTLREAAVRKMLEGITTFEEVVSVTG